MNTYTPTIGIEVHAELKTRTKMFCDSANDPSEQRPNVNVCPICMGHPGTLPTINKEAVRHILRMGIAIGGTIADFTEFDRKHYFYPDLPKGYQISQYKHPLVSDGELAGVAITRIHLEEDTAKSIHSDEGETLLDFNRSGVPLMELVTEPFIHTSEEASRFGKELQTLLRVLGASSADMDKGQMRVEANISVSKVAKLGTKVEVKNINSFKALRSAIDFEIDRQVSVLESGGEVSQETRGWDEHKGETVSQRSKEEAHDYRYFPEPDLPKLYIGRIPEFSEESLRETMPRLPWEKRKKYEAWGLSVIQAETLARNEDLGTLLDNTVEVLGEDARLVKLAANYILSDLTGMLDGSPHRLNFLSPTTFAQLIKMLEANEVSSRGGKDILRIMVKEGGEPRALAEANGLFQNSNKSELLELARSVLLLYPEQVAAFKKGKTALLAFFVGHGMRASQGAANPEELERIFRELLGE